MKINGLMGLLAAAIVLTAGVGWAHCDTLDGPVVADAKAALAQGDVTPVLKWLQPGDEDEIKTAFAEVLKVRGGGEEARNLADRYFFETVVRLHRAGEGAPYTGLKAAGADIGPAVAAADESLASGSADKVIELVTHTAAAGMQKRFEETRAARASADQDVVAGRDFVKLYVEYVHYVERLYNDALGAGGHGAEAPAESHHEP